jgi:two-component system CheB/CheR fusion protein
MVRQKNKAIPSPDEPHLSAQQQAPQNAADSEPGESAGAACPVAGFGASAGGLEAFRDVLQSIPDDTGIALVFIMHLDPKHASMLTELLSRSTRMPVSQVEDGMQVEANQVYVIPPNTCISIRGGRLVIEPRAPAGPHLPVDHFFRSLAEEQGSKAIGVVLSGTASDGTLGLRAIKEAGGITFAQKPGTAKYDGMPVSAIMAGCVDTVLPPDALAAELARLGKHPYLNKARRAEAPSENHGDLNAIFGMLRAAKGVDFSQYKSGTIGRRTLRRMALHKLETPEQYVDYLKTNRDEIDLLFHDLLINVTGFFREPATFNALITQVLPAILERRSPDDAIRVWVPGCATGEEAYSVAICLLEQMRREELEIPVQLFGTDPAFTLRVSSRTSRRSACGGFSSRRTGCTR